MASGIESTGFYGIRTTEAVKKFQLAYKSDILTPVGLTEPTGVFATYSINKMNQLLMNKKWFISSSGDGDLSLTLKSVLLGIVPVVVTLVSQVYPNIEANDITQIINVSFSIASGVGIIYGILRKIYNAYKTQ
jgi:hypothetical protein